MGNIIEDIYHDLKEEQKHWEKNSAGSWEVNFKLPDTIYQSEKDKESDNE